MHGSEGLGPLAFRVEPHLAVVTELDQLGEAAVAGLVVRRDGPFEECAVRGEDGAIAGDHRRENAGRRQPLAGRAADALGCRRQGIGRRRFGESPQKKIA